MSVRLRLAAVVISLLIPAVVLAYWQAAARASGLEVARPVLPQHVGSWTATAEDVLSDEALAIIEPDAHLLRRYEAPGRTPIWIYVGVYAGRAGYGKGAHDPEVCYPAQGWEILHSRSLDVPVGDSGTLRTKLLGVHLETRTEAVLYWFQPAERWPGQLAVEELLRVLDAIAGRPQYAFVRLSGPSDASPTADEDLAEFAAAIAPSIRTLVEAIPDGTAQPTLHPTRDETPRL